MDGNSDLEPRGPDRRGACPFLSLLPQTLYDGDKYTCCPGSTPKAFSRTGKTGRGCCRGPRGSSPGTQPCPLSGCRTRGAGPSGRSPHATVGRWVLALLTPPPPRLPSSQDLPAAALWVQEASRLPGCVRGPQHRTPNACDAHKGCRMDAQPWRKNAVLRTELGCGHPLQTPV